MAKQLQYMGFTVEAHRIALFDPEAFPLLQVDTKEVEILPDVSYSNCSMSYSSRSKN